jgi:hypothetical protein
MQSLREAGERAGSWYQRNPTATTGIIIGLTIVTLALIAVAFIFITRDIQARTALKVAQKSLFNGNFPPMIPEPVTGGPQGAGILKAMPRQVEALRETLSATPGEMAMGVAGRPLSS